MKVLMDTHAILNQYFFSTKPIRQLEAEMKTLYSSNMYCYISHKTAYEISSNQNDALIIGEVFNPTEPQHSPKDICDYLSSYNEAELFSLVHQLTGRFVILVTLKNGKRILLNDSCSMLRVLYTVSENEKFISSSDQLLTRLSNTQQEQMVLRTDINQNNFIRSEHFYPTSNHYVKGIKRLLPNHILDLNSFNSERMDFAPIIESLKKKKVTNFNDVFSKYLNGFFEAAGNQNKHLKVPVTAGYDSRALVAASKKYKSNIEYFTFEFEDSSDDVTIANEICYNLKLNHNVFQLPREEDIDFTRTYTEHMLIPRQLKKIDIVKHHSKSDYSENTLIVNGNAAEVMRLFYGRAMLPKRSFLYTLLSGCPFNRSVKKELKHWLRNSSKLPIDKKDLFYWEHKLGAWGSIFPFEQDIAVNEISPFNNRTLLLSALINVPKKNRGYPDYPFFRDYVNYEAPELTAIPYNPHEKGSFREKIKKNTYLRLAATFALGAAGRM